MSPYLRIILNEGPFLYLLYKNGMCSISFGLAILIMRVLSKLLMIIGLFDKKYQKN